MTVTDEMLESSCVLHIADLSPNDFFLLHIDDMIHHELAQSLLKPTVSGTTSTNNVFLISIQSSTSIFRIKRSAENSGAIGGTDLLVAVYDPLEKRYIESNYLVQRIHALQANLSKSIGHQIHAYNSLCAQKVGSFYTAFS